MAFISLSSDGSARTRWNLLIRAQKALTYMQQMGSSVQEAKTMCEQNRAKEKRHLWC